MKTEKLKLGQIALNERNPRTITDGKMQKLINSILVFPKMLSMRPVVIDETNVALGGNMRLKALQAISQMSDEDIAARLATLKDYNERTGGEQETLLSYWTDWLADPQVEVVQAATLSEREKKEFIIKDNVSFGQWDWTMLDNEWDTKDLGDWGMDVWTPAPTEWNGNNGSGVSASGGSASSVDGVLPPELQGQDLTPDELPKLEGDNETANERVIIVYPADRAQELADLLGLESIEKVVYSIDELQA